jgi:hypothetical protein
MRLRVLIFAGVLACVGAFMLGVWVGAELMAPGGALARGALA